MEYQTMGPTQITVAIIMVGLAVAIIMWIQSSLAAASARRMKSMMARVGLNPGPAMLRDLRTMATIKEARRRCRRCPREGLCERWLAGEVEGDNTFCPNAQIFDTLEESSGRTN
jgi:hypothetical protein